MSADANSRAPAKCEVNMTLPLSFHFLAPLILYSHPIFIEDEESEGKPQRGLLGANKR